MASWLRGLDARHRTYEAEQPAGCRQIEQDCDAWTSIPSSTKLRCVSSEGRFSPNNSTPSSSQIKPNHQLSLLYISCPLVP